MTEIDPLLAEMNVFTVNTQVIGLTPSVTLASSMLALAGAFSRDQLTASNQAQLNAIAATLELGRGYAERDLLNEALGLVKQVVATAQTS